MRTIFRSCTLLVFGLTVFSSTCFAADELNGYVVKLAEKTNLAEPQNVNVGGLVIAVVRDSGSRPPLDIAVKASENLQSLGTVRGVQNDEGVALMGGGYTWHLFKPTAAGEATVNVSYTENGNDGKKVKREFKVSVN
jgi:hypothetical protein